VAGTQAGRNRGRRGLGIDDLSDLFGPDATDPADQTVARKRA